jgi:hypothetical protein
VPFSIFAKTREIFKNDFYQKPTKHINISWCMCYIYQIKIYFNGIVTIEPNVQKKCKHGERIDPNNGSYMTSLQMVQFHYMSFITHCRLSSIEMDWSIGNPMNKKPKYLQ